MADPVPVPVPVPVPLCKVFTNPPASDLWGTPPSVKVALEDRLGLKISDFDPCPYPLPEGYCGLSVDWGEEGDVIFVNPPFSRVDEFAKKGVEQAGKGRTVLMFVAARMDNKTWQYTLLPRASEVMFMRSRVTFTDLAKRDLKYHARACFPSATTVLEPWQRNLTCHPWDWVADYKRLLKA